MGGLPNEYGELIVVKFENYCGTWTGGIRAIFSTPTEEKDSMKFRCGCLLLVAFFELGGTYKAALFTVTTATAGEISVDTFGCCA
jgi:hypothetical protein